MATIAENLQRIETAKSDIRTAIIGKGVDVPSGDTIDTYAAKIVSISTGSTLKLKDIQSASYTANGSYSILPDSGYDGMAKVDVEVNVPQKEEQGKAITITSNGTTTVEPDSGKSLAAVTITTNVPSGGWNGKYAVLDKNVVASIFIQQAPPVYIDFEFQTATSGYVFYSADEYRLDVDADNNWRFWYYDSERDKSTPIIIGQLEYNGLTMHFFANLEEFNSKNITVCLSNSKGQSISKTANVANWGDSSSYGILFPCDTTDGTAPDDRGDFKFGYFKISGTNLQSGDAYWVYKDAGHMQDLFGKKPDRAVSHYINGAWRNDGTGMTSSY